MRQKNRIAPLCLAAALVVVPLTPHAMAAQTVPVSSVVERIDPRFEHISRISCGMTISADGYASSTGSYTMYDGNGVQAILAIKGDEKQLAWGIADKTAFVSLIATGVVRVDLIHIANELKY